MSKELSNKRKVTTRDTMKVMQENGMQVSENEAEIILDFLYFLAKLTVNQYVKDEDNKSK